MGVSHDEEKIAMSSQNVQKESKKCTARNLEKLVRLINKKNQDKDYTTRQHHCLLCQRPFLPIIQSQFSSSLESDRNIVDQQHSKQ